MGNSWGGIGVFTSKESTVVLSSFEKSILASLNQNEEQLKSPQTKTIGTANQ